MIVYSKNWKNKRERRYIAFVLASVLVNENSMDKFIFERGLQQRDYLPLFLFLTVAEGLQPSFMQVVFSGFHIRADSHFRISLSSFITLGERQNTHSYS
jgi:predicted ABC-type exoprotein transport system permease subunit